MPTLLRFGDLKDYGVNNWPTLGRWIKDEGAPAGFYLGGNTRAWHKEDWDAWLAARPKADPPPEIAKPRPCVSPQGTGPVTKAEHPLNTEIGTCLPSPFQWEGWAMTLAHKKEAPSKAPEGFKFSPPTELELQERHLECLTICADWKQEL